MEFTKPSSNIVLLYRCTALHVKETSETGETVGELTCPCLKAFCTQDEVGGMCESLQINDKHQ